MQQGTVRRAFGVALHFSTGVRRLIYAAGTRYDPRGYLWEGVGVMVGVEGLAIGIGARTQPLKLTASGLDVSLMTVAQNQAAQAKGAIVEVFEHWFRSDWQYIEAPSSVALYIADKLTPAWDGQARTASITLTCEPLTVSRWRAPNSYLDHRSQSARHPGDLGLSFMSEYAVANTIGIW